nr:MAG TPA: large terminase protein [Ackermannviridae sp.]
MYNEQTLAEEYALSYADKSRIYFVEKYLSTFNANVGKKSQFLLFPRQKAFMRSLAENKASIAIKHRQAGITTVSSAWICAQIALADESKPETILCIGNKLDLANQLVTKIREFLLQVPRWYWGPDYYSPDPKSEKNKKDIFIKNSKSELQLFNGCAVYARSSGENAARGISAVSILIFDEAAFIENGTAVYSSAVAATSSYGDKAKIIMVSTPNGKDELYYNTYRQALSHENNYNAVEFKWYQDLRYNRFLKWYKKDPVTGEKQWIVEETLSENGDIEYNEARWRKLEQDGWSPTSPWYETMCQSFNNDTMKIAQELDVSFLGSANNVVASEFVEKQSKLNVRDPLEDLKDPMVDDTWYWKPPIHGHRYIMGIDPSRGVSSDRTAIEVIDMDGRDENGMPIIEQVMEYVGKRLGDDIGSMAVYYAQQYNNAYVVVDCTGGQGDAVILTMLNLGYKNLHYDDSSQKTYTMQSQGFAESRNTDRLPGFHFQGNRYPVLSNFAGLVRNNEFKIRSVRVINELDTWIFKGENGRMDHMNGSHDDTITCLAMALFIMQFSLSKIEAAKKKDEVILKAYRMSGSISTYSTHYNSGTSISPRTGLPNNIGVPQNQRKRNIGGNFLWVFGSMR